MWGGGVWGDLKCSDVTSYLVTGKERNVLFNDALNTFLFMVIWCRIYLVTAPTPVAGIFRHICRGTDFPFQIFPFSVSEFNKFRFFPFPF